MLPIALQLYSIRDEINGDLKGSLREVKEMGYEGVELAGLYGHSPAEIKALLIESGLTPVSAHISYEDTIADPEKMLSAYKEIGCSYVAIPWLNNENRPGAEKWDETLKGLRLIAETAKKLGITLLYHNHDFEFKKIDGEYALDILFDSVAPDLLQAEMDTCWITAVGVDVPAYLGTYKNRLPAIHIKDFVFKEDSQASKDGYMNINLEDSLRFSSVEFRPLGQGRMDIPPIIKAAEDAGTKWIIVEHDSPPPNMTSKECALEGIKYLKGL